MARVTQQTLALVGAVGGAGTTRTAVEFGATLAREGRDVAILDAAFATQGLADYLAGRIETDITSVLADEADLADALVPVVADLPGELVAAPARAPFERVARAKTAGAAERFERQIAAAGLSHDAVIVDTPPVAANQAVAAINACDRVALVAPATRRGADGVARVSAVIEDVGAEVDDVVATFADGDADALPGAAGRVPTASVVAAADCPSCLHDQSTIAEPVAAAVEAAFDTQLAVEFDEPTGLDAYLNRLA
jgi:MinD-like ATPase involved in chromosome partitioning or flagellar assembly